MVVGIVLIIVAAIILIWSISTSNNFKKDMVRIDESRSSIDIMIEKRYTVLSESLKVAKSFAKHEDEVFSGLINVPKDAGINEMNRVLSTQNEAMNNLYALGQRYPELKSHKLYATLQEQLSHENEHFAAAKRAYNSNVARYNQRVVSFPDSVIANLSGYFTIEFIKEDDIDAKKNYKLDL